MGELFMGCLSVKGRGWAGGGARVDLVMAGNGWKWL